jgi:hemin uptake protein HemP
MSTDDPSRVSRPESQPPAQPPAGKVLHSEELFAGERIVLIEHAGEIYRLQITARNRLLLQK